MNQIIYKENVQQTYKKVKIHQLINFDKESENPVKVSIVVPVCNVEEYLRECLDSAINQTLQEIEIICINDGSTDHSLEILEEYARKDFRVKVIDKDNAGYGHAMNIGMDMAEGEYIGIIESDDYVLSDMYEVLYEIAKREDVDFVKSDFYRFYGKGEKLYCEYNRIAREIDNYNIVISPSENQKCFKFIMNTWSGIYKTEFLRKNSIRHNETPGASYQDNGFWFQANMYATRTWYVDRAFYMNRRDNPNSSVHNPEKVYCANLEYDLLYAYLKKNGKLEKFLEVYIYKKYHTYMFTLKRIAPKFRKEYLQKISKEFSEMEEKGELISKYLSNTDWNILRWIIRDPMEYYYNKVRNMVKVSVILPVYNVAPYLEQCLNSLLEQTLKDIEIICIDDGSTDNSLEILTDYRNKDWRIRVVEQKNQGAGTARNNGMKLAQGKYLSFLDADDYFDKDMLRLAYNQAEEKDADICIYESNFYDNETGAIIKCDYSVKKGRLPKSEVFSRAQIEHNIFLDFMGWAWDKLYKRSFILNNDLKFQEQRTTNDMFFVYASLLKAGSITLLNKPLYYQRRNVNTSLSHTRELSWDCFYHALIKIKEELHIMGIYEEYEQNFVNYALHSCLWNFNSLKEPAAEKLFHKLREEWFYNLGIIGHEENFWDNSGEYEQFMEIMNIPIEDSMSYMEYRINYWKNKYMFDIRHSLLSIPVEISDNEILTVASMKQKLKWNRLEKTRLEEELNKCRNQLNNIEQLERSQYELNEIRKSFSYRLAMFFTWIPRHIRKK